MTIFYKGFVIEREERSHNLFWILKGDGVMLDEGLYTRFPRFRTKRAAKEFVDREECSKTRRRQEHENGIT